RQRGLNDQVSLSTIHLSLTTEPVVEVDDSPNTFLDGLETRWNGLVGFVSVLLVVLGVLLPWLMVLAVITFAIIGAFRARRSYVKNRAQAGTPVPAPPPGS